MERRLPEIMDLLVAHLAPPSVTLRHDAEVRLQEGLPLAVETVLGELPPRVEVREGAGQAVGGHQGWPENRAVPGPAGKPPGRGGLSRGEVLDAFAYQGAFAMHLAPGANRVTLVESSGAALAVAQENASLNGYKNLDLVKANVFTFLKEAVAEGRRFDCHLAGPAGLCQEPPGPGGGV